jgi:hypothetical protein
MRSRLFTAALLVLTTTVPLFAATLKVSPPSVTGLSARQTQIVSERDGTATIGVNVLGAGAGTCNGSVMAYDTKMDSSFGNQFAITPSSGFPKPVTIVFPRPGTYQLLVKPRPIIGECPGTATTTVIVKAHPEYPCSLYPNFHKSVFGDSFACVPSQAPANVKKFPELCPPGTTFVNHYGYIFGCIVPALDAIK